MFCAPTASVLVCGLISACATQSVVNSSALEVGAAGPDAIRAEFLRIQSLPPPTIGADEYLSKTHDIVSHRVSTDDATFDWKMNLIASQFRAVRKSVYAFDRYLRDHNDIRGFIAANYGKGRAALLAEAARIRDGKPTGASFAARMASAESALAEAYSNYLESEGLSSELVIARFGLPLEATFKPDRFVYRLLMTVLSPLDPSVCSSTGCTKQSELRRRKQEFSINAERQLIAIDEGLIIIHHYFQILRTISLIEEEHIAVSSRAPVVDPFLVSDGVLNEDQVELRYPVEVSNFVESCNSVWRALLATIDDDGSAISDSSKEQGTLRTTWRRHGMIGFPRRHRMTFQVMNRAPAGCSLRYRLTFGGFRSFDGRYSWGDGTEGPLAIPHDALEADWRKKRERGIIEQVHEFAKRFAKEENTKRR